EAGTVRVGGIAGASAAASNGSNGSAAPGRVNAQAEIGFGNASHIDLGGVAIDVTARQLAGSGSHGATALANFTVADTVNLSIGGQGITVVANAVSLDGGNAVANAIVDITQDNLAIDGSVTVAAAARNLGGGSANAMANLHLEGVAGNAIVLGQIDVSASAS